MPMQSTKGRDATVEMSRWVCRDELDGRMDGVMLGDTICCVLMALRVAAVVDCWVIVMMLFLLLHCLLSLLLTRWIQLLHYWFCCC